jgi:hypothetical protein
MSDRNVEPPEANWSDYIDALRRFEPPTPRLARRQRALDEQSDGAALRDGDGGRWWKPPGTDKPRT